MSKEFALSKEVAEEELERILNFYEIDLEADLAADEGLEATAAKARVAGLKKKLINAIRAGRLEVQEEGPRMVVIQHLTVGGDLTVQASTQKGGVAKLTLVAIPSSMNSNVSTVASVGSLQTGNALEKAASATIGQVYASVLFVVYTVRHEDTIRIISARKALSHEQKQYREANA
jgi:hypothetical protein